MRTLPAVAAAEAMNSGGRVRRPTFHPGSAVVPSSTAVYPASGTPATPASEPAARARRPHQPPAPPNTAAATEPPTDAERT